MIIFAFLRTRRLSVQLRELKISEIIDLLSIPGNRFELSTTEMLKKAADRATAPTPAHVTDPRMMTVQERMRLTAHYLGHVSEDGGDFLVGSHRLSDYSLPSVEWDGKPVVLSEMLGKPCMMWPLFGWMAEALERICSTRGQWQTGAMACQMMMGGEKLIEAATMSDADVFEWVKKRMTQMSDLPESDFALMLDAWATGDSKLTHFYRIAFQDDGLVVLPTEESIEEAGELEVAPGRFPAVSCISDLTKKLFGRAV